jgi:hypothetical protein
MDNSISVRGEQHHHIRQPQSFVRGLRRRGEAVHLGD